MIGIVIVAHGRLAEEYLSAVEHVVGRQQGIHAVQIQAEYDKVAKEAEIKEAANAADVGQGTVIVVDMFGGSPSNLSLNACGNDNRRVLYGANLPMLVKLAKCRTKSMNTAVNNAVAAGRKYLDCLPETP